MAEALFTDTEVIEILTDAANIDVQQDRVDARIKETGTVVPLRLPRGTWELMRLDQREIIRNMLSV